MKKLSVALSVVLVFAFVLFAVASSDSESTEETVVTQSSGEVVTEAPKEENVLGDYKIEIKAARLTEDYEGKPVVVVSYGFTNNSSEASAFWLAFEDNVYQDGVGLEKAYVLKDGDPYDEANQNKEIKSGVSLDVDVAYVLNNTESDIEVEVSELVSFTDDVVSRTFSIK